MLELPGPDSFKFLLHLFNSIKTNPNASWSFSQPYRPHEPESLSSAAAYAKRTGIRRPLLAGEPNVLDQGLTSSTFEYQQAPPLPPGAAVPVPWNQHFACEVLQIPTKVPPQLDFWKGSVHTERTVFKHRHFRRPKTDNHPSITRALEPCVDLVILFPTHFAS